MSGGQEARTPLAKPPSQPFHSKPTIGAEPEDNVKKGNCLLTKPIHSAILKEWRGEQPSSHFNNKIIGLLIEYN